MLLVINCGSSTIKFALFPPGKPWRTASGVVERIQSERPRLTCRIDDTESAITLNHGGIEGALREIASILEQPTRELAGIGHRVVHGGDHFKSAARIDCGVLDQIEELAALAPLHNPAHVTGIRTLQTMFPGVPQFAVFDTAFHQTMPGKASRYALPEEYCDRHRVRRYGFHGTSHQFVAQEAAALLNRPLDQLQLITVHLGNGCSACAIRNGGSVDTTMGLTPQEGMMMGTRSGDVDPALHRFLETNTGRSLDEITRVLTEQSGLLGVSGSSNDVRELEARMNAGDEKARFAIELFCYRAAKGVMGMAAALTHLDALVFTGGIGEHSPLVRGKIVDHLSLLGLELDTAANAVDGRETGRFISSTNSRAVLVVQTDEELAMARQVGELLQRA
jgi:acetate kinase